MLAKKDNQHAFSDPFSSPLLEILTKDAHGLISKIGREKIISAFEISNANPESSVRNPLLIKSFNQGAEEKERFKTKGKFSLGAAS